MASFQVTSACGPRAASAQAAFTVARRRFLSLPSSSIVTGSSCGVSSSTTSCSPIADTARSTSQQVRSISSMGRYRMSQTSHISIKNGPPKHALSYSALRNKVTMPFEVQPGEEYISPYSDFFANIDAGRTSLGTTQEMEENAFQLQEQYLDCGIPESALRFRTTSYGRFQLAPFVAPGEHRVVVKIPLSAVPFENDQEKDVLLQIVGSRYNSEKDELQFSSEKFASRIENKRHLVGMIERIVSSARRLAKEFAAEDEK